MLKFINLIFLLKKPSKIKSCRNTFDKDIIYLHFHINKKTLALLGFHLTTSLWKCRSMEQCYWVTVWQLWLCLEVINRPLPIIDVNISISNSNEIPSSRLLEMPKNSITALRMDTTDIADATNVTIIDRIIHIGRNSIFLSN